MNTVVNGTDKGAIVRECDRDQCGRCAGTACRRGVVQVNKIVWVTCQEPSDFTGGLNVSKPVWFRVKWPVNALGILDVHQSSPDDQYSGWMIGIYLAPQTNETVPAC